MRVSVDDSNENVEAFKAHLLEIKDSIENEIKSRRYVRPKPEVRSGLDKKREEIAFELIAIQTKYGSISWAEVPTLHKGRIQELQKKYKIPREKVIDMLVKNVVYQSYSQLEIQNYASLLEDIDKIYNQFGKQSGVLPLNALSKKSGTILNQYRVGVSNIKKVKLLLQIFRPEIADINVVLYDYKQTVKPAFYLSPKELKFLADEVKFKFADKNGNIDKIFAPENEEYLKKLITALKLNHITFEEFIRTYSSLSYTKCYNVPSVLATQQMLSSYYDRYQTFRGLQNADGYLCRKVDLVKMIEQKYTIKELLEYWGWYSDNATSSPTLSSDDLDNLERELITELLKMYPDRKIGKGLRYANRNVYEKAQTLAKRKEYEDLDEYLLTLGFCREKIQRKAFKDHFCLSERDLLYYGFINPNMSADEIEKVFDSTGIVFADVENYTGFYRRLAYNKQDGPGWRERQGKNQSQPQ